jgi:hypothetical protein
MVFEEDDVLFAGAMRVATLMALMQYESVYTVLNAGEDPVSMTSLLESFADSQSKDLTECIAEALMAPHVFGDHDAIQEPLAYECYLFGLLAQALQCLETKTKEDVLTEEDIEGLLRIMESRHEEYTLFQAYSFLALMSGQPINEEGMCSWHQFLRAC